MINLFGLYSLIVIALLLVIQANSQSTIQVCSTSRPCLNGGVCENHLASSRESIQLCNCKNAIRRDGTRYSGIHCEKKDTKGTDSTIDDISNDDTSKDDIDDGNNTNDGNSRNNDDASDDIMDINHSEDDAGSDDTNEPDYSICSNGSSCLNGGICANNRCICPGGFKGLNCDFTTVKSNNENDASDDDDVTNDRDFDDDADINNISKPAGSVCPDGSSCLNGGRCINNTCVCRDGFIGRKCEKATVSNNNISPNSNDNNITFSKREEEITDENRKHRGLIVTMFAPLSAILAITAVLLLVSYSRSNIGNKGDEYLKRQMVQSLTTNKRNISSHSYIITEEELRAVAGLI